jgi:hypothetical protein
MFGFGKKIIEIDPINAAYDIHKLTIKKHDVDFTIALKQTVSKYSNYVWFIHAYITRYNAYRVIAFSTKTYTVPDDAFNDALNYFNKLDYEFFKVLKQKN